MFTLFSRLLPELLEVASDKCQASVKQQQRRVRYWRSRQADLAQQQLDRLRAVAELAQRALPPLLDAAYHSYASAQVQLALTSQL